MRAAFASSCIALPTLRWARRWSAPAGRAARRAAAAALVLLLARPAVATETTPPSDQATAAIEHLHEVLLGVMKDAKTLGFSGRYDRIEPALEQLYDFPFMAEKSVGLGWRQLDEAERARLTDAFARLAIATYAARFDGYDGARFETLGVQPASHDTVLVNTRIVRGSGETVALDYRMRAENGRWRIIDVFLNGTVSELALRRSEYSGVLKREGFDALLQAIEQKIAAQERGANEA